MEAIQGGKLADLWIQRLVHETTKDVRPGFHIPEDEVLGFKGRLCMPDDKEIKKQIFYEAQYSIPYAMHLRTNKMYQDLKRDFLWVGIKRDVAELPHTLKGHGAIWVIVDKVKKSAHFLPIKKTDGADTLADLYIAEIVQLHRVPIFIVPYRDSRFTFGFWKRRKFQSPIHWHETGERIFFCSEEVDQATEDIRSIRQRLQTSIDYQRKYADRRRRPLEFEVGENVLLKIAPLRGAMRFGKKGKLSP
ncbi:uncharacterized protein LOC133828632 [Humulus lupulus]|uniref:uncharacterized protein LOC133828632 n=1 Tax=Humulus lupulus TaxID=3486 RepID=UPI002B412661|nr:uncharacterized protein LOC133828632 [Humulus lupulus]